MLELVLSNGPKSRFVRGKSKWCDCDEKMDWHSGKLDEALVSQVFVERGSKAGLHVSSTAAAIRCAHTPSMRNPAHT